MGRAAEPPFRKERSFEMRGIGTIVNVLAVLLGGGAGLLLRRGLRPRLQEILMQAMGLATVFIGLSGAMRGMLSVEGGALVAGDSLGMILSLVLGGLLGELLNLDGRMEQFGTWLKNRFAQEGESQFVEGFVTASLVICVGAMAVVGALQDGLGNGAEMLYAKALLDGIIVWVFASTYGKGAVFSAIPVGLFQGAITLSAVLIAPLISDAVIANLSFIGSILISCVGINLCFGQKFRVANLLPALVVGVCWTVLLG